jgi:hypothetical protein
VESPRHGRRRYAPRPYPGNRWATLKLEIRGMAAAEAAATMDV